MQATNLPNNIEIHGTALQILGMGVLLIGESGIGKSELAIELLDRGHQFICDDLVSISLHNKQLYLSAPHELPSGFVEIRGIGFLNIDRLYHTQITTNTKFDLIIELVKNETITSINNDRLEQLIYQKTFLGYNVTNYQLPVGVNRNLAVISEIIIKYHKDKLNNYDSHKHFIQQMDDRLICK